MHQQQVAINPLLPPLTVFVHDMVQAIIPVCAPCPHTAQMRHPGGADFPEPADALPQRPAVRQRGAQERSQERGGKPAGCTVQNGRRSGARREHLTRVEIHQGAGPGDHHPAVRNKAGSLQQCLRTTHSENPGQGPARERDRTLHGSGRKHDVGRRKSPGAGGVHQAKPGSFLATDVPDRGFRQQSDPGTADPGCQFNPSVMIVPPDRPAVGMGFPDILQSPIDLSADGILLVHQRDVCTGGIQGQGRRHACGTAADNDNVSLHPERKAQIRPPAAGRACPDGP